MKPMKKFFISGIFEEHININGVFFESSETNFTLQRLMLIIKSKFNKNKRAMHIEQLERELGIIENQTESPFTPENPSYETGMRCFHNGALYETDMCNIDTLTVEQYTKINISFNPNFRVELDTFSDVAWAIIRTIDGTIRTHIYLTHDHSTVVIYGDRYEFSDVCTKLERDGYIVEFGPENCYDFQLNPF